jgi:hypothetical protein
MVTISFSDTTAFSGNDCDDEDYEDHEDYESYNDPDCCDSHEGDDAIRALICYSVHARRRARQRNLDTRIVRYVLDYGRIIHRTGILFYFLGARDIPYDDRRNSWATRLVGTVLVVAQDGAVITLYRNPRALQTIRRKMKYRSTPGWPVWPPIAPTDPEPQAQESVVDGNDARLRHEAA